MKITLKNQHIRNYSWRIIQFVSKQSVNLFILYFAAKNLDKETFGIYNYIVAIAFLFTVLADFGISRAVTKFTAEYNAINKEIIKKLFFNTGLIVVLLSTLLTIFIYLFAEVIADKYYDKIFYLLPLFYIIPLSSLFDGIYIGLRKFKKLAVINLISAFIGIITSYNLINDYGLHGAFYSLDTYYGLLFIIMLFTFPHYSFKFDKKILYQVGGYAFIIGFASLGQFLYSRANSIIMGKFNYLVEVGFFEISDKILVLSAIPFMILGQVIAPGITEKLALKRNNEIYYYYKKIMLISLLIGLIISVSLYFIISPLISHFFVKYNTPEFYEIFNLLLIQLPFLVVSNALAQPFIVGTGNAKLSLLTIPFGILNVILGILLITEIGYIGMIYSTLITSIGNKLLTYFLLTNKLRKADDTTSK